MSDSNSISLAALREEALSGGRSGGRAHARLLAATERLLATTPLHDLTVEDILQEADVSRPTFYSYFSSKNDLGAVLYERTLSEMYGAFLPAYERGESESPEKAFRQAIDQFIPVWMSHRAVFRLAVEHRHTSPELMRTTLRMVDLWVPTLAAQIERDRDEGVAPPGGPPRPLVLSLLWSTEKTLYVAGLAVSSDLPDERAAAEPLAAMWLGAIYGIVPKPR